MNNFFSSRENNTEPQVIKNNHLWQYVQGMAPETIIKLSQPTSPEVFDSIERSIVGLLGTLPDEDFEMTITTNRQNLVRLLASAMINGYFLCNVEQRMKMEKSLALVDADSPHE